jgi:hypothetical protein
MTRWNLFLCERGATSRVLYLTSISLLLGVAGISKTYMARGEAGILDAMETLFPITTRYMLLTVGSIELLCAVVILCARQSTLSLVVVLWLGGNFAAYRIAGFFLGNHKPCPCLGKLGEGLPFNRNTLNTLLEAFVVYMILGSAFYLWLDHRGSRPAEAK